jgi:ATP-dependent Lon protease
MSIDGPFPTAPAKAPPPGVAPVDAVPVLSTAGTVVFPGMRCLVRLRTPRALAAIRCALASPDALPIAVFAVRERGSPELADGLFDVGTAVRVLGGGAVDGGGAWAAEIEAVGRVRALAFVEAGDHLAARLETLVDPPESGAALRALCTALRDASLKMGQRFPACARTRRAVTRVLVTDDAAGLPGAAAGLIAHLAVAARQRILQVAPLSARLEAILCEIHTHLAIDEAHRPGRSRLLQ